MKLVLQMNEYEEAMEGSDTMKELADQFSLAFDLVGAKNLAYGDSWRRQGWMGNLARIMSKISRLQFMLWRTDFLDDSHEGSEETARDLMNLCAFFLLNQKAGNRWGTDND